jgi:tetratricopeptide (TPR) repeat protein
LGRHIGENRNIYYWNLGLTIEPNYSLIKDQLAKNRNTVVSYVDHMNDSLLDAAKLNIAGVVYFHGGLYDKAEHYFRKSLQINPESSGGYLDLGRLYLRQGLYDKAEVSFKSGIEVNPDNYLYAYYLGRCYFKQKQYDKARTMYERTVVLNPDYGRGYFALGEVYAQMGRVEQAGVMEEMAKNTFHDAVMDHFWFMTANEE